MPSGSWQGTVVTKLTINEEFSYNESLARSVGIQVPTGSQALWLETNQWGKIDLEKLLVDLKAHTRIGEMPIFTIRSAAKEYWSHGSVDLMLDITVALSEIDRKNLPKALSLIKSQRPYEVIWRNPKIELLTPDNLDLIFDHLGPESCWMYVDNEDVDYCSIISRSHSDWGVRKGDGAWRQE